MQMLFMHGRASQNYMRALLQGMVAIRPKRSMKGLREDIVDHYSIHYM